MTKLLVCGSRTITDPNYVWDAINYFIESQGIDIKDLTVIEGKAKGVDTLAKVWAQQRKIPVEEYPAEWDKYGKAAGYIRNEVMVKACDICLILWDGESKGTKHDIDLCVKYDKKHIIVKK